MTEKEYLAKLKTVRAKLKKAHIPAVVKENSLPDLWLRRVMNGDIKRPAENRLTILDKYFNGGVE